jgi:phage terminase large subunit-like protein
MQARFCVCSNRRKRSANIGQIDSYFPPQGPHRRELYGKHMEFFAAGDEHRERAFIAANRVGKTLAGAFEITCHLTGDYPAWWDGRRFNHPVVAWAAGDSSKTTRDIIQLALYGPFHEPGTGMIPRDKITRTTTKTGIADCIETIYVQHASGGVSEVGLKSYDQQRDAFQGTNRHVIWLDEEPPYDIYVECLLRTMVTNGLLLVTATPLQGMTDVMRAFIQPEEGSTSKFFVQATWDDVPHLDAASKQALLASIPPYQREARSKGVPQLGAGAIYQVPERDIVVPDFAILIIGHAHSVLTLDGRKPPQCLALTIAKPASSISIRNTTQASSSHHCMQSPSKREASGFLA